PAGSALLRSICRQDAGSTLGRFMESESLMLYPPWAAADIKLATQPRNNEIDAFSPQMNGARTIVIKRRAGTLFDSTCDKPAAQRSEQIGVKIIHTVHNHWLLPA